MAKPDYKHPYAYRIIQYVDTVTGDAEYIWNSRDGGVFEEITSLQGNPARMKEISPVVCEPKNYLPELGDRIFVDLTPIRARVIANEVIDKELADPAYGVERLEERFKDRVDALEQLSEVLLCDFNADLLIVSDGWLREYKARQGPTKPATAGEIRIAIGGVPLSPPSLVLEPRMSDAIIAVAQEQYVKRIQRGEVPHAHKDMRFVGRDGQELAEDAWRAMHDNREVADHDRIVTVDETVVYDRTDEHGVQLIARIVTGWLGADAGDGVIYQTLGILHVYNVTSGELLLDKARRLMSGRTEAEAHDMHRLCCARGSSAEELATTHRKASELHRRARAKGKARAS